MTEYHNAVDEETKQFVNDVIEGREVLPLTIGFVDSKMGSEIKKLTGLETTGNRIVLAADDVRHIIKRHGAEGESDHSMANIDDIARISYVLANYDKVEWNGSFSRHHFLTKEGTPAPQITISKRIDGEYFIVEVAADGKRKRNAVITAFLKKAAG